MGGIAMYSSWLSLMMLAAESQQEIMLRTLKLAIGSPETRAQLEATGQKIAKANSLGSEFIYRRKIRNHAFHSTQGD
jgi:hypothetical protein